MREGKRLWFGLRLGLKPLVEEAKMMLFAIAFLGASQAVEIPHTQFTLENGLDVLLIEDDSLPQVVVDVWYDVGSFDDPEGCQIF